MYSTCMYMSVHKKQTLDSVLVPSVPSVLSSRMTARSFIIHQMTL